VTWPYTLPATPALSRGTLDRGAERRGDAAWLQAAWESPAGRVLVVGPEGRVHPPSSDRLRLIPPAHAPEGERYLLGVDGSAAVFAVRAELPIPDGVTVRDIGAQLSGSQAGLLVHAVALANWHATHGHCPRCGAVTEVAMAGHERICPQDGSEHFPRTDPAMIVLVVDEADRALLGHHGRSPAGGFSTLAGFVEPGESLEQAVRREVAEEAAVEIADIAYAGSQPWPFPASLMLGCFARAKGVDPKADGVEVLEARWFTREALARETEAGTVRLAPRVSIARLLIEGWYGAELLGRW
jgi:NAD+ diphosphatase